MYANWRDSSTVIHIHDIFFVTMLEPAQHVQHHSASDIQRQGTSQVPVEIHT